MTGNQRRQWPDQSGNPGPHRRPLPPAPPKSIKGAIIKLGVFSYIAGLASGVILTLLAIWSGWVEP